MVKFMVNFVMTKVVFREVKELIISSRLTLP